PDAGLVISPPLLGRLSNQWVIVMARRITAPDGGGFAGIAYAALPVRSISGLFAGVDLGPGDAIALRGPLPALGVIARYPETVGGAPAIGNPSVSPQLQMMAGSHPDKGTYLAQASIDGIERVLSYHKVGHYPYIVVVGQSTANLKAESWGESLKVIALTAAFLLMTTVGSVFAYRALRLRRLLEMRLTRKNDELARFAEILAHHMKEPVRQQHIFTQHLARLLPKPLSADVQQSIDAVVEGAKRHLTLLRDAQRYLDLNTLDVTVTRTPGDAALDEALARLDTRIAERNATIERSPLPDLPVPAEPLAELFETLIENAILYGRPGIPPCVTITATCSEREAAIAITDNGLGIPPEFRDRVFRAFERLDTGPHHHGTGIGLALAKKIVESVGGSIWLEAPDTGGTRVCISFPR
ncbi:MAG TPA: ATP-binding protein, partial [Candidatus Omnitrophota bacterium]|nr:ATP-binding protein [Candidatus Omnitrophota bacterium]